MSSIHSHFLPENHYWHSTKTQKDFYLYFEIEGTQTPQSANRIPLNLSLVIDRSGSMEGAKIDFAKKAAQFVIQNLEPRDFVSVVQYDNEIDVVSPAASVTDKAELTRRIESITARNMTNLSGGLLSGYNQAGSNKKEGLVNRVLLLSDGLANQGITDPALLQKLAQEHFREKGIGLSTFGVGADFDEQLMSAMSEYGGGNYYFIDSPDKIPAIFAKELKGLLAVVAQETTLEIQFPDCFTCEKVYGYPAENLPSAVRIRFNDVFSLEKKAVLLKMHAWQMPVEDFSFIAQLRFTDAVNGVSEVHHQEEITIRLTSDEHQLESGIEKKVAEQTTLFHANDLLDQAAILNERGENDRASSILDHARLMIQQQLQSMPNSLELRKLLDKIEQLNRIQVRFHHLSDTERIMYHKEMRFTSHSSRKKKID